MVIGSLLGKIARSGLEIVKRKRQISKATKQSNKIKKKINEETAKAIKNKKANK